MKILEGTKEAELFDWFSKTVEVAKNSRCMRSRCGSIIIKDGEIIGKGYNSPPSDDESQRRCGKKKSDYDIKVTDKTCCMHAEQRAIFDALKNNPDKIAGSRLFFIRLDKDDKIMKAKEPYCTICSKIALDVGIKEFVLWHDNRVIIYNTKEYNDISYEYGQGQ